MKMIGIWREKGFADFAKGTFGNGGQNIYVSKNGVLQRIFRFDINRDGYADVLFVNSQDMGERPPVYVYLDPLGSDERIELPTAGGYQGALGDLNGDGYEDLVVANQHNGTHEDVTAFIYYGSPEGLSERYKVELPVPNCRAVAIGDFNGDGRPDIAFSSDGKLVIYYQTEIGFLDTNKVTLDLNVTHMTAGDIDGDGCTDLYVRVYNSDPIVLWGGKEGLQLERHTPVGGEDSSSAFLLSTTAGRMLYAEGWLPKLIRLNGSIHLFRQEKGAVLIYPAAADRTFGHPLVIECTDVISVAAGDVNGSGHDDLILAVCKNRNAEEQSWIYWGEADGFDGQRRTALTTISARDVYLGDLDGDGLLEIVICQGQTDSMYSTESLIYKSAGVGIKNIISEPKRLPTHDATAVLAGRTSDADQPQLIFINHVTGGTSGDVSAFAYLGGKDGFSPDRRLEFPGWSAVDSICCDFSDNGWGDVLIVNCAEDAPLLDPGCFVYWGGPNGFDPSSKQILPTYRAHGSAVGDFRKSGYLDVAFAGINNPELLIYHGGPNGFDSENPQRIIMDPNLLAYTPSHDMGTYDEDESLAYRQPRWLFTADFNNDGWLDIFVSQIFGHSFIMWGGPEGFSMERITRLGVDGGICAQAADLNGNGWLDLVIGGHMVPGKKMVYESYVYIYWGGPEGYLENRRTQLPAHTANSITIADFNNDGILDIFITSYNSGRERDLDSYIYWGEPGGTYTADNRTRIFTHSSCGCVAADYNEDGWIDIAVANHKTNGDHNGDSYILWNGPEGFSEKNITALPTHGPHGMMSVDPANVMNRSSEEFYISSPFELPQGALVTGFVWEAEIQPKTWVKGQIRFADSTKLLNEAKWQGPQGVETWFDDSSPLDIRQTAVQQNGNWIQYKVALGAVNGGNSPRITEIRVEYEY